MNPRRDWSDAREKVEAEGVCRACLRPPGYDRKLEAAHVIGRKHDKAPSGKKTLYVHPDSVIPLCSTPQGDGCHQLYDAHRVTITPFLTVEEQARAVLDAGSLESARRRLDPFDYGRQIEAARVAAFAQRPELTD